MDYIQSNLSSDEKIIAKVRHSWAGLVGAIIGAAVLVAIGIVTINIEKIAQAVDSSLEKIPTNFAVCFYIMAAMFFLLGALTFCNAVVQIKCDQLVLTNKRVLGRRGFISKSTTDILLSHVDTLEASNGFFGAIFHYGSIRIVSSGTNNPNKMKYNYITNTVEFRKAVLDQMEAVKAKEREEQAKLLSSAVNKQ